MSRGVNPSTGFTQVVPTADERAAWDKKYPRQAGYYPYRSKCSSCGKRIWHSGIGIGSHRRACPGAPPVEQPVVTDPVISQPIPEAITTYCEDRGYGFPQIVQVFMDRPGNQGWADVEPTTPTYANLRSLKAQGATTIGISANGGVADFEIAPILRAGSLPLLGGSLIGSRTR